MNLKDLKGKIEKCLPIEELVILKYADSDYIAHQYIHKYLDYTGRDFVLLESLDQLRTSSSFLVDETYLYKVDKFECTTDRYKKFDNLFIVCKSIEKKTEELYKDYIVEIPKLEQWQILDYIYFVCPTLGKELEPWAKILNNDMYAIENEVSKISIFSKTGPEIKEASADEKALPGCILTALNNDNAISYLSGITIFDLITALFTKNINKITTIYQSELEVPPVLFYQLVYNTVEDIIKVVIDPASSADRLGMASGKYWAIKNTYKGYWTKEQITNIFQFLVSIDKQIKTGKLTFDNLLVSLIIGKILEEY